MTTRYTFTMMEEFGDDGENRDITKVTKTFHTDSLHTLIDEFRNFLWNCTFNYVDSVEVVTDNDQTIS